MTSDQSRIVLQSQLFPAGIPRLWCPTLTHFRAAHQPDTARIQAHLTSLSPCVKGILVPGSTGEGWEMSDADIRDLLAMVTDLAADLEMKVLIGVLKTTTEETIQCMQAMQPFLAHSAVVGFTICPPKGSELGQQAIYDGLAAVLREGLPMALYQLPQVTQNEMSPETVATLASDFPNFILFKDTSGGDRVAESGLDLGGVFMVRGSEQAGYAQWLRSVAGPYDGFLLSTANVFAHEFARMIGLLDAGQVDEARELSSRISAVVNETFKIVEGYDVGNAFTNANKVLDHCFAYGDKVLEVESPLLYSGHRLPMRFVEQVVCALRDRSTVPTEGYLTTSGA